MKLTADNVAFANRLADLGELMGLIGANDMGHLPLKLAAKFHKATALIVEVIEFVEDGA